MIHLDARSAVVLYLSLTLLGLLVLWLRQKAPGGEETGAMERGLFHCEFCAELYLECSWKGVTRCPCCQGWNKDNRYLGCSPHQGAKRQGVSFFSALSMRVKRSAPKLEKRSTPTNTSL